MRISKYVKLDSNILMEYIYDDANLISEPYKILIDIKDNNKSFLSTENSGSLNTIDNQLFLIDPVERKYGKVNTSNYSFLQENNYASGFPLRYDTVIIRLPINYTFGEYIGFYLRAYSFDITGDKTYDLCNFYFDISDVNTKNIIEYTNPPILFQEKLWGKEIKILIPSLYEISGQRKNNVTTSNSVNYNLTSGVGMSQQTPIFFEYSFITNKQTINSITTYNLASKVKCSLSQIPEFQKLGVQIKHSTNGDYFEINGLYNNNIGDFKIFMDNSVYLGNRYYLQYIVTIYEQNIRGKTVTYTVTDNFNDVIEYRPIIKFATTTAVIDVSMYLIDAVDSSQIIRNASYGLLQDEVSKYGRNLTKINLANSTKPKIYNQKIQLLAIDSSGNNSSSVIETVNVPYAVLIDKHNVVAKSDSVISGKNTFFGEGKLVLLFKPFDNIIKLTIASNVVLQNGNITPKYLDMSALGEIKLIIKNSNITSEFSIFQNNGEVDLANGSVVFKISANKISDIRRVFESGINIFYVTSTQQGITSVVYSGLFKMFDSVNNVNDMNNVASQINSNTISAQPTIIADNSIINIHNSITKVVKSNNLLQAAPQKTINSNLINKNI